MRLFPRILLVIAVLFCLIFSAVRSDARVVETTPEEQVLTLQEKLEATRLPVETWQELMKTRTWRSATGDHKTKAQFVRFDPLNNKVILKNSVGKELPVAVSKLSENDRRILGDIAEMLRLYESEKRKGSSDPCLAVGDYETILHFAAYVGMGRDTSDIDIEMLHRYMEEVGELGLDSTERIKTLTPFLDAIGFRHAEHWHTYGDQPYHWTRSHN